MRIFTKLNRFKKAMASTLVLGMTFMTAVPAFGTVTASTPPSFASASYDVAKGQLIISGSDISGIVDLSKVLIKDSVGNIVNLSTKSTKLSTTSSAIIALKPLDQEAMSILNNTNTGSVYLLKGWDGTSSTAYAAGTSLSVTDKIALTSSTYDSGLGKLTLNGAMATSAIASKPDIDPKRLIITDGANKAYQLTTPGTKDMKVSNGSVNITLNKADVLALQSVFQGTTTSGAISLTGSYDLMAIPGWNGTSSSGVVNCPVTVSNYAGPAVTVSSGYSITFGKPIVGPSKTATVRTGISVTKAGTVYVIPSSYSLSSSTTKGALDLLVLGGTALSAPVIDPTRAISIPTKVKTSPFKLTTSSAIFVAVAADLAGTLSEASTNTITINNVPAPALRATLAKGTTAGAIKFTSTTTSSGLAFEISAHKNTTSDIPITGTVETVATTTSTAIVGTIYPYTSGSDIVGVDPITNKYLNVFQLDSNNAVVAFSQMAVSSSIINTVPAVAGTVNATGSAITFNLASGTFNSTNAVKITNWTLGGTNKADLKTISSIALSNGNKTATITITGTVASGKNYTVKPLAGAFSTGYTTPTTAATVTTS